MEKEAVCGGLSSGSAITAVFREGEDRSQLRWYRDSAWQSWTIARSDDPGARQAWAQIGAVLTTGCDLLMGGLVNRWLWALDPQH